MLTCPECRKEYPEKDVSVVVLERATKHSQDGIPHIYCNECVYSWLKQIEADANEYDEFEEI